MQEVAASGHLVVGVVDAAESPLTKANLNGVAPMVSASIPTVEAA